MSRREEHILKLACEDKLCHWCKKWPRESQKRCDRCGHVDGSYKARIVARPGHLSPSKACRSTFEKRIIREIKSERFMHVVDFIEEDLRTKGEIS